jgi:hypothetical protein
VEGSPVGDEVVKVREDAGHGGCRTDVFLLKLLCQTSEGVVFGGGDVTTDGIEIKVGDWEYVLEVGIKVVDFGARVLELVDATTEDNSVKTVG